MTQKQHIFTKTPPSSATLNLGSYSLIVDVYALVKLVGYLQEFLCLEPTRNKIMNFYK